MWDRLPVMVSDFVMERDADALDDSVMDVVRERVDVSDDVFDTVCDDDGDTDEVKVTE